MQQRHIGERDAALHQRLLDSLVDRDGLRNGRSRPRPLATQQPDPLAVSGNREDLGGDTLQAGAVDSRVKLGHRGYTSFWAASLIWWARVLPTRALRASTDSDASLPVQMRASRSSR